MSYDIYIGEIITNRHSEDPDLGPSEEVFRFTQKDAPVFPGDEMTGRSNGRHPSYSGWAAFAAEAGLTRLFFDKLHGLMREHPGTVALTSVHHRTVLEALTRYQSEHPDAVPGFAAFSWDDPDGETCPYDPVLARLIWLEWWMRWALEHCQRPGFHNH